MNKQGLYMLPACYRTHPTSLYGSVSQIFTCIGKLCCLADRVVCALEGCLNLPAVTAAVCNQGALED